MFNKLFILSADDDMDDQDMMEEALKKTSFDHLLTRVPDGYQLLNMLNEISMIGHRFPDLIFLDLNMPVKNGRETLKILKSERSAFRNIPLVVFTTSRAEQDVQFCTQYGVSSYVVKPASFRELIITLEDTITAQLSLHNSLNPQEYNS
jgi:CheY-like chemotaxis protein